MVTPTLPTAVPTTKAPTKAPTNLPGSNNATPVARTIRIVIDPFTDVGLKPGWSIDNSRLHKGLVDCQGDVGAPYSLGISTHWCGANADSTNACWTAQFSVGELWCLDPFKPSSRRMFSVTAIHVNDDTPAAVHAVPLFVELADGSRWWARTGGAWSDGPDGLIPVYGCANAVGVCGVANSAIFTTPGSQYVHIDKSHPVWRVQVGQMGPSKTPLPKAVWMPVSRVWFMAGHRWHGD
ncbi:MAG: hypothetical protein ACJ72O_05240 [Marmoricola sp.]